MITYTLYSDDDGNPIITRCNNESLAINFPRREGVEISENEAIEIAGKGISIPLEEKVKDPSLGV